MQSRFHTFLIFNFVILIRPKEAKGRFYVFFFPKNILFSLLNEQEVNKLSTFFD